MRLFRAAEVGNLVVLKEELDKGTDPNFFFTRADGIPTPLHSSAGLKDELAGVACTELLLRFGAKASTMTKTVKNTPLHEAAFMGQHLICRMLLDSDSSVKGSFNAYGNTPLHAGVYSGSINTVKMLLEKGTKANVVNNKGSTPLHICAFLSSESDESTSIATDKSCQLNNDSRIQIARLLLANDRKIINSTDENGYTALHVASLRGCVNMVKLLVKCGASLKIRTNIDSKGRGGRTAVRLILIHQHYDLLSPPLTAYFCQFPFS